MPDGSFVLVVLRGILVAVGRTPLTFGRVVAPRVAARARVLGGRQTLHRRVQAVRFDGVGTCGPPSPKKQGNVTLTHIQRYALLLGVMCRPSSQGHIHRIYPTDQS